MIIFMMIQTKLSLRSSVAVLLGCVMLLGCEPVESGVDGIGEDKVVAAMSEVVLPDYLPKELVEAIDAETAEVVKAVRPHKALYDIELVSAKNGSQILDISGQMLYELRPACDGWVTNHHFKLDYQYADGISFAAKSDFSTFERYDGTEMTFLSHRGREGQVIEAAQGVVLKGESDAVRVEFQKPEPRTELLPANTLFPVDHSLGIMRNIKDGQRFVNDLVFDGSDETLAYEINTFIGDPVSEEALRANLAEGHEIIGEEAESLLSSPGHRLRMAFFDNAGRMEQPDYEMSFTLLENNLVSDMVVEYSDFSVRQSLKAVEALDWPDCGSEITEEGQ